MKKRGFFTAASLTLCLIAPHVVGAASFKDMPTKDHWSYPAITYAVERGYLTGYEDGTIQGNRPITRAEAATMIHRTLKKAPHTSSSPFKDVNRDDWFYDAMMQLYALGYLKGVQDDIMAPHAPITREATFTIMSRILSDTMNPVSASIRLFNDDDAIASWQNPMSTI